MGRNWRKEEPRIKWQLNALSIWHKHIRLLNSLTYIADRSKRLMKNQNIWVSDQPFFTDYIRNRHSSRCYYRAKTFTIKLHAFANIQREERNYTGKIDDMNRGYEMTDDGFRKLAFYLRYNKPWNARLRTSLFNNIFILLLLVDVLKNMNMVN